MKIDWTRKLTSRKLWLSLVAFITLMVSYITGDKEQATQIAEIVMASGVVIGYVVGEGLADSKHNYINDPLREDMLYDPEEH